jgi:RNA polymerase sigma factor (sigma-70 family)
MSSAAPEGSISLDAVNAARDGNADAIAHVYRVLAPAVVGYLRGAGATDPEALAGDVFVGLVRSLPRFAGDGAALRTYVFAIAHRRLVDERRRQGRRGEDVLRADDDHLAFAAPDEFEAVLHSVSAAPVRRALGALTADQRAVVLLRVVADLSLAETARVVQKPVPAVKMLQRRALAALSRAIPEKAVT